MSRGRAQEDRRSLEQSLGLSAPHSLPVTAGSSSVRNSPAVTAASLSTPSTTLFNAVASRAARVTDRHYAFTGRRLKTNQAPALSASSPTSSSATTAPCKVKSTSSSGANKTVSPKATKNFPAVAPEVPQATRPAPISDSDVLERSDAHPGTTASDTTAPSVLTAPETNDFSMPSKTSGAAPVYDQVEFAAIYTPEETYESGRKSTAAREKTKKTRPKPGKAVSGSVSKTRTFVLFPADLSLSARPQKLRLWFAPSRSSKGWARAAS